MPLRSGTTCGPSRMVVPPLSESALARMGQIAESLGKMPPSHGLETCSVGGINRAVWTWLGSEPRVVWRVAPWPASPAREAVEAPAP